jgi:hypothetical protein
MRRIHLLVGRGGRIGILVRLLPIFELMLRGLIDGFVRLRM